MSGGAAEVPTLTVNVPDPDPPSSSSTVTVTVYTLAVVYVCVPDTWPAVSTPTDPPTHVGVTMSTFPSCQSIFAVNFSSDPPAGNLNPGSVNVATWREMGWPVF